MERTRKWENRPPGPRRAGIRGLAWAWAGLALAVALCACGGPEIPEYEGRTLEEWIERARGPVVGPADGAERQREQAFAMLETIGAPAAPALGSMVSHPGERIGGGAVEALRRIGAPASPAVPDLLQGLKRRKLPEVRRAIPQALAEIAPGAEEVQFGLIAQLGDADDVLFQRVWAALGQCFDRAGPASDAVVRRLINARENAPNSTREEMIWKLMTTHGLATRPAS